MEIIICCACSLAGFVLGLLAGLLARRTARRPPEPEAEWLQPDDALSRDIAAMLAYTGPRKEAPREDS